MTQTLRKLVTFEEFVEWKPDGRRYELHDGVIVEMPQPSPTFPELTLTAQQIFQAGSKPL
jgi:Uma2 family endonuclease